MWNTSYYCDDGVVVSLGTSQLDETIQVSACRDYIGEYGGGTWVETDEGFSDIQRIYVKEDFVIALEATNGVMIENPCLCAAVNSLNHIEQWLRSGGVIVNMGARNATA